MNHRPSWSSVIVVPRNVQFAVIARGFNVRNVNFPGGRRAEEDANPTDTAIRELREETGLFTAPEFLRLIDKWSGADGYPVYAYLVENGRFRGRVRSSSEGRAFWTAQTGLLTSPASEFRDYNRRLLKKVLSAPTTPSLVKFGF